MVNKISRSSRKRKQEEYEDSQSEGEFSVNGLIDGEASESENEDEILENREGDVENNINREQTSGPGELDDDISSEELEKLLEEEEEEEGVSDVNSSDFSDEPKDNSSITDKLSNIRLRNLPQSDDFGYESKYSDGSTRIIKPEIDPVYDSDENDGDVFNTIGNVPLSAYEEMPHIGYDINGKRIMRPAKGSALDQLLESIDLPDGWTGLLDKNSGAALKLSDEELDLIKKIQLQENTDSNMNPYEPTIEWFTSQTEVMPLTAAPEPKRRFVPSKHEAKRVMKIVRAIREGRIIPPSEAKEQIEDELFNYDLWTNESETNDHIMNLRAPKIAPPTNDESYNPPEEYLLTEEELKKREELDPEERDTFVPQKYTAMRKIPGYQNGLRERFERCLDLYLAPRVRHNKLNIDIDSLIPELPSPKDLRPFPIRTSTLYEGHTNKIRTLSVSPSGNWLATGSDDGTIRIWEVLTGRQVYMMTIINKDNKDDHIEALEWNPDTESGILAVAAGENIYLIVPPIFGFDVENEGKSRIESGWGYNKFGNVRGDLQVPDADDDDSKELETGSEQKRKELSKWVTPSSAQAELGVSAIVQCKTNIKTLSWHRKGDYFVTVAPDSKNTAVLIHQMSKHLSQSPFKKSKGIIVDAKFHPFKPQFFVASQRTVKIYDLSQQTLIKRLMPGARLLSSIDIHPRGDNLLASSYDKRVLWHDLDLSATPYKTLRYHEKAVRSIKFHKGSFPLFASASDDGSIHVFHGTVYDDLMSNALLVPLKKLTGHKVINSLGILDLVWHPKEAWLFSAGADGTARLWTT